MAQRQTQKEKDFDNIRSTFRSLYNRVTKDVVIDHKAVARLFWTDEQIAEASRIERAVHPESLGVMRDDITLDVSFDEDQSPMPDSWGGVLPNVRLGISCSNRGLFPHVTYGKWRDGASPEGIEYFEQGLKTAIVMAYDRALFMNTYEYLLGTRDWNFIRYMFPGIRDVMRRAGLGHLANKHETIRSVPHSMVSKVSGTRSKVIRHVNNWFATHLLLGTFDKPEIPYEVTPNGGFTIFAKSTTYYTEDLGSITL